MFKNYYVDFYNIILNVLLDFYFDLKIDIFGRFILDIFGLLLLRR